MSVHAGPNTVEDGLVLALDAANPRSYPGTGITWSNLIDNGTNVTLTNGPTYNNANSGAIEFDGTTHYGIISSQTLLSSGSTISVWCNITDFATGKSNPGRAFIRSSGTNFLSLFAFYSGGYGFETNSNSNPLDLAGRTSAPISASSIQAGIWFNFTLVFNAGVSYEYVNGVQVGTRAIANNLTFDRIGDGTGYADNYPGFFKGVMSLINVYNRASSAAEVQQNFIALRGRFGI